MTGSQTQTRCDNWKENSLLTGRLISNPPENYRAYYFSTRPSVLSIPFLAQLDHDPIEDIRTLRLLPVVRLLSNTINNNNNKKLNVLLPTVLVVIPVTLFASPKTLIPKPKPPLPIQAPSPPLTPVPAAPLAQRVLVHVAVWYTICSFHCFPGQETGRLSGDVHRCVTVCAIGSLCSAFVVATCFALRKFQTMN